MAAKNPFSSLFGHSPFKPMQEHMRTVARCVDEVPGLFEALCAGDMAKVEAARVKIITIEGEADRI